MKHIHYYWRRCWLIVITCVLITHPAHSQIKLVKDINSYIVFNNEFGSIVEVDRTLFFVADNALWKTDGTPQRAVRIKKFSRIKELINLNGRLLFVADDGKSGLELWRSDGTARGTVLLKDINAGKAWSNPSAFTTTGRILFFVATTQKDGTELWRTDGTRKGTFLVEDILPGPGSGNPHELLRFNDDLFFSADDGVNGVELRILRGGRRRSVMVKDVNPGVASSNPENLTIAGTSLFFSATTPEHGNELWKTDGTSAGTAMVKDVWPGVDNSYSSRMIAVEDVLYFIADDGINGSEFWKSDGNAGGTVLAFELNPGPEASFGDYPYGADYGFECIDVSTTGGKLYFAHENQLFGSDGTNAGTRALAHIADGGCFHYSPKLFEVGGTVYVFVLIDIDGEYGFRWSLSKIENSELVLVKELPRSDNLGLNIVETSLGLIFPFPDERRNCQLWTSDGTTDGTYPFQDVSSSTHPSSPKEICEFGDRIVFLATGGMAYSEVWISNGTEEGTYQLTTDAAEDLTPSGNFAYFYTFGRRHGLSRTDGTIEGTIPLIQAVVSQLTDLNGTLYFALRNESYINDLWMSKGTPETTMRATTHLNPELIHDHHGRLYVQTAYSFWTSDGMSAFTKVDLEDRPVQLVSSREDLYFVTGDRYTGQKLWKTNGTTSGTVLVKDLGDNISIQDIGPLGNGVVYSVAGTGPAAGLWSTDGKNVVRLLNVADHVHLLEEYKGALYFVILERTRGSEAELWKTDGTARGTKRVKRLGFGYLGYQVDNLDAAVMDDILYFAGIPENIWRTNGTSKGTFKVGLSGGGAITDAQGLYTMKRTLYFQAKFPGLDAELGKLDAFGKPEIRKFVKELIADLTSKDTTSATSDDGVLHVYPNPFTNTFTFTMNTPRTEPMTMSLRRIDGHLAYKTEHLSTNQTYTAGEDLAPGLYFLQVKVGARTTSSRILKKK
jgi:trimeric autotransporter adhesin